MKLRYLAALAFCCATASVMADELQDFKTTVNEIRAEWKKFADDFTAARKALDAKQAAEWATIKDLKAAKELFVRQYGEWMKLLIDEATAGGKLDIQQLEKMQKFDITQAMELQEQAAKKAK